MSIATGILSVQRRISLADARVQLQVQAYASGRSLIETAQTVLKGTFPTDWSTEGTRLVERSPYWEDDHCARG